VAPRGGGCWHVHGGLLRDGPAWPADHLREMPDQGIGRAVPISRLNLDEYNLLTVHS
ncbi:hypothetical protein L553_0349, partial [Bordetella pertussis I036]